MLARAFLLCLLIVSLSNPVAAADSASPVTFGHSELKIATEHGTSFRFNVEVAETDEQLKQGLMYRDAMPEDAGMLFLLGIEETASFWMHNTFIPLDMLFVARDGRITNIHRNAAPGASSIISSTAPVIAVIELNAGITSRLGINPGDRVIHPAFH